MKALVTGSSGLVGSYLVKALCREPVFSRVLGLCRRGPADRNTELGLVTAPGPVTAFEEVSCDLAVEYDVRQILKKYQPDVIFHLAGYAGGRVDDFAPSDRTVWQANVTNTLNLLGAAPEGCRFLLASSATVYGDQDKGRFCYEWTILSPTSVYGASKVAAEALVTAFTSLGKIRGLSLRLVANVGKNARHGLLPDLVRKVLSDSTRLELLGDMPGSVKPYMHASDTARAMVQLALSEETRPVNISPLDNISVGEIAQHVMGQLKRYKPVRWLGEKANFPGDNRVVLVNNSRLWSWNFSPKYKNSLEAITAAVEETT